MLTPPDQQPFWLLLDPDEALRRSFVIGWQENGFLSDSKSLLEEILARWIDRLHENAQGNLTTRQASIEEAMSILLDAVRERGLPCMAVELLPGECLILAHEDVLRQVKTPIIVERAHYESLLQARELGLPYNEQALRFHERRFCERQHV